MKNHPKLPKLETFEEYRPPLTVLRARAQRRVINPPGDTFTPRQLITDWICCFIAAGIMTETLFFKFTGAAESIYIFRRMGTEPWWRWGQGSWELVAAICLLVPRLRWVGGILTTGAMAAALLSQLTWLGYSIQGDHGLLFCMASVTFICGSTVSSSTGMRFPSLRRFPPGEGMMTMPPATRSVSC